MISEPTTGTKRGRQRSRALLCAVLLTSFGCAEVIGLPPPNDAFALAETLVGSVFVDGQSTQLATREPGEPPHGAPDGTGSLWWRWRQTPPDEGQPSDGFLIVQRPVDSPWQWSAYLASTLAELVPLKRTTLVESSTERSWVRINAGDAVLIAAENLPGVTASEISFSTSFAPSPANDRKERARTLSPNPLEDLFSVSDDNRNATTDPSEVGLPSTNSVWFAWPLPWNGAVTVSFLSKSHRVSILNSGGTILASRSVADDQFGGGRFFPVSARGSAGQTLYLAIGSVVKPDGSFEERNFNFNAQFTFGPPNDDFTRRTRLTGLSADWSDDLFGAGIEPNEPNHGPVSSAFNSPATVWFTWSPPTNSPVLTRTVRLAATQRGVPDVDVAVYRGGTVSQLTRVPSSSSRVAGITRQIEFLATKGEEYHIALAGDSHDPSGTTAISSYGLYRLNLDASALHLADIIATTTTNQPVRTVKVVGSGAARNDGILPSGPLRLRLVARDGYGNADPFEYNAPLDQELLTTLPLANNGLAVGISTPFQFDVLCPAPDTGTGYVKGWGVVGILEEQRNGKWIVVDSRLIAVGAWPDPTGGQEGVGPGNGAYRFDPARGVENLPKQSNVSIEGPGWMLEGQTTRFILTVAEENDPDGPFPVDVAPWRASNGVAVGADGKVVALGPNPPPYKLSLEADYAPGGSDIITAYKELNVLTSTPTFNGWIKPPNGPLTFQFLAPPGTCYLVEKSYDLLNWSFIRCQQPTSTGVLELKLESPLQPAEFFRVRPAQ